MEPPAFDRGEGEPKAKARLDPRTALVFEKACSHQSVEGCGLTVTAHSALNDPAEAGAQKPVQLFEPGRSLGRPYVFGTRALGALSNGERHALSFAQFVIAGALNGGLVEEVFRAIRSRDEPKSLVRQSLDRSVCVCWHECALGELTRSRRPGIDGAEERTRTSTPLRAQAPEACASANSATSALKSLITLAGIFNYR